MFFSVSRLEHGEKCHLMKVVKKIPTSPQNRDRPALPYLGLDPHAASSFHKNLIISFKKVLSFKENYFCLKLLEISLFLGEIRAIPGIRGLLFPCIFK